MATASDSVPADFASEGLAISGQSLEFLLRIAGWLTVVAGIFLSGFGVISVNLLLGLGGLGLLLEGLILIVAAGFVRNLADAVDRLLALTYPKRPPGAAPQT